MLFSVLIYSSEDVIDALSEGEIEEILSHHYAFQDRTKSEKSFGAAVKLMSTGTAVTLHRPQEELLVTDGPFAETKEQLMGFYLLEADTLDEAIEAVKLLPLDKNKVEIRPVSYFDGANFRDADRLVLDAS
ncbi:MAG: YciI family protein [Stappiaceae bacterium]